MDPWTLQNNKVVTIIKKSRKNPGTLITKSILGKLYPKNPNLISVVPKLKCPPCWRREVLRSIDDCNKCPWKDVSDTKYNWTLRRKSSALKGWNSRARVEVVCIWSVCPPIIGTRPLLSANWRVIFKLTELEWRFSKVNAKEERLELKFQKTNLLWLWLKIGIDNSQ